MGEKKSGGGFSLGKNLKISQAQQILLLAVLASSLVLGVAIALSLNFISHISFNAKVIMEKDQAIVSYSTALEKVGVCKKPKDSTYSESELKNCNPSTIDVNTIPGTLRYNIVNGLAANVALNSVPKADVDIKCVNPDTLRNYTIKELNNKYVYAESIEERESATNLLKTCSALRAIPDALPAYNNQEAMLSSLNKIFNLSGWIPDSLTPDQNDSGLEESEVNGYYLTVAVDADSQMIQTLLRNFERSIRNIDIVSATLSYGGDSDSLKLSLQAAAYFVEKTELSEETKTVDPNAKDRRR
ncbi:hypothetical protein J6X90_02195 [Candidatus Saccharibacteria bacterium]|nr:hypothetical protein [Candidatus Saccharibacteria bacterium]